MEQGNGDVNPFAVPRPLFARRKRSAPGDDAPFTASSSSSAGCGGSTCACFFTPADYARYSVHGAAHESRLYLLEEKLHQTLVTPTSARTATQGRSPAKKPAQQPTNHLALLLAQCVERSVITHTGAKEDVDNVRRRLSALAITEHERYLELQRKIIQAQRRGLPRVLALSAEEATQWQKLEDLVRVEQLDFFKMMVRVLTAETASQHQAILPFVSAWYDAMLMQCRNDVYRLYPRYFEPSLTVALPSVPQDVSSTSTPVKRAQEVAARGACCVVDVDALRTCQPLQGTAEEGEEEALGLAGATPRLAISADLQAERLMEQYDCDVAVSSSTLVALFDSDTSTRFAHVPNDWVIPVKSRVLVRPGERGQPPSSKKQIYLDRPLPSACPTTRQKIAEAGRAALLSRFEKEAASDDSTGGRTVYHVWELANKRVLVRSTTHAWMKVHAPASASVSTLSEQQHTAPGGKEPAKESTLVPLSVFVKPDYRTLMIEEQLTTSERSRFWLHSWLRGSSVVLVARFNPTTGLVDAWERHSLTSLVYGDDTHTPLECFDPMAKFQWVSELFSTVADIPAGNYLLRSWSPYAGGKSSRVLEILTATPTQEAPAIESSDDSDANEDTATSNVLDLYDFISGSTAGKDSNRTTLFSSEFVLPTWHLTNRIPYTYQTGSFCKPFFLDGVCPLFSEPPGCPHAHLRFSKRGSAADGKSLPAGRWRFDDYDNVLKKAVRDDYDPRMPRPRAVVPQFPLCPDAKAQQPLGITSASLHIRPRCPKPVGECKLPHLTLYEVLERLADATKRLERTKRRKHKESYRQRRLAQHPNTDTLQEPMAQ